MQPKVIVLLGPPGSGKGTQGARLSAALETPAISTGEMLRRESESGSPRGEMLAAVLKTGSLLVDEQMNELVRDRLRRKDCRGGFILDGFPRTVNQARFLDRLLTDADFPAPTVLDFSVCAERLIERLQRRRQCPMCGQIYSTGDPTQQPSLVCSNDRSLLTPRVDDQPRAIRERMRIYERNSAELVQYYQGRGYHLLAADRPLDEVTQQVFAAVGLSRATLPVAFVPAALTQAAG